MSEYQYYEFLAVDRPLAESDRKILRELSTRARITATQFVNSYQWGNFKGDPAKLMERWFDLHLYCANGGTRRLMLRVTEALARSCAGAPPNTPTPRPRKTSAAVVRPSPIARLASSRSADLNANIKVGPHQRARARPPRSSPDEYGETRCARPPSSTALRIASVAQPGWGPMRRRSCSIANT